MENWAAGKMGIKFINGLKAVLDHSLQAKAFLINSRALFEYRDDYDDFNGFYIWAINPTNDTRPRVNMIIAWKDVRANDKWNHDGQRNFELNHFLK
jgi:hypothetical protein